MPGLLVSHHLLEFAQVHAHCISIYLSINIYIYIYFIYIYIEREREREVEIIYIYNQELVHDITEAGESKICTSRLAGCQLREKPMLKSKGYQDRANVIVQIQRLSSA